MDPQGTALVLSGGGARGAYEVGVIAGIVEVLGLGREGPGPFSIFTGTSVGAINCAFLAAHNDRGDMGISGLVRQWTRLKLGHHVQIDPLAFFGFPRRFRSVFNKKKNDPANLASHFGRAILDPRPLERLVQDGIPWDRLHENIRNGNVRAHIVSALRVAGGIGTIFAELAPGAIFHAPRDPRRVARIEPVTGDHVLASAAIPLLFPARRIGRSYYYDGGLRSNTPIAPALRAGAQKLVVISLLHPKRKWSVPEDDSAGIEQYPNTLFLLGKVLDALLLDPVDYDLQVLERFNNLIGALEHTLTPYAFSNIMRVLESDRGNRYRRVQTLTFRPSEDIGILAGEFLRSRKSRLGGGDRVAEFVLSRASSFGQSVEADLGSFLLFDGGFAEQLIDLGKRDALHRAEDIRNFFRMDTIRPAGSGPLRK